MATLGSAAGAVKDIAESVFYYTAVGNIYCSSPTLIELLSLILDFPDIW